MVQQQYRHHLLLLLCLDHRWCSAVGSLEVLLHRWYCCRPSSKHEKDLRQTGRGDEVQSDVTASFEVGAAR